LAVWDRIRDTSLQAPLTHFRGDRLPLQGRKHAGFHSVHGLYNNPRTGAQDYILGGHTSADPALGLCFGIDLVTGHPRETFRLAGMNSFRLVTSAFTIHNVRRPYSSDTFRFGTSHTCTYYAGEPRAGMHHNLKQSAHLKSLTSAQPSRSTHRGTS
jgi:hypothetical protein